MTVSVCYPDDLATHV